MSRASTIIFVTKIMVEVLKMNLLLWCFRTAARMAMTTDEGCRAEYMPSHGDVINENVHAKSIGLACNGFDRVLKGMERDCAALGR
jgi:hypothetical protein